MMPVTSSSMYNTYSLNSVNAETSTPVEVVKREALVNRTFVLTKVNGAEPADSGVSITFDENLRFLAKAANCFKGQASYDNGVLKNNGEFFSSRMVSSDTEILVQQVLKEGVKVSMNDNALILQSNSNTLVFE